PHCSGILSKDELKKANEKLKQAMEHMESDYIKWLDIAQCQLEELGLNLQSAEQELLQYKNELETLRTVHSSLDKRYSKAKQYIKEFQRREKELIQWQEYHVQQLQEKDQEYNSLVKALKDRSPDRSSIYDIFTNSSENIEIQMEEKSFLNARDNSFDMVQQYEDWDKNEESSFQSPPLTLLEEMKVAVAARQARINSSTTSEDNCELGNDLPPDCVQITKQTSLEVVSQTSTEVFTRLETFSKETSHSQSSLQSYSSQQNISVKSQGNSSDVSYSDHSISTNHAESCASLLSNESASSEITGCNYAPEIIPSPSNEEKQPSAILSEPAHQWSAEQVALWLQSLGFDHHVPQFLDSDITGQILLQIDSSRLKALGVLSSAERSTIKRK
ncbi:neurabin-1, partial [Trichonephila clavata]